MLCKHVWPCSCRNPRRNGSRLAILAALAVGSLRQRCLPADAFSPGERFGKPLLRPCQARASGRLPRRAAPQIPADELAPDEIADKTLSVLPKLPPLLDTLVGGFLYVFPVVVIASWVMLNVTSYEASKKAKERDEKRKIRKAIQVDETFAAEEEAPKRRRRRRRPTAFEESLALEEAAKGEKSDSVY
mmetsp:Transcript_87289/g.231895  ORF Transcript_87289/g.231895 Transcript_87289/m.231895 type:complete len:188 (-) Transcript_87289:15-578(-)